MDGYIDAALLGPEEKFAIGQPVPHTEDSVLLRGKGRYADDVKLPGQANTVMTRRHIAHGMVRGIETAAARTVPGVLAICTAADLARAGIGPLLPRQVINNRYGTPMLSPVHYALPSDKVRYVSEAVAAVVVETVAVGRDAAELVVLDIDPLPAITWQVFLASAATRSGS
jgi:aerobic carbon-monoxide dehydrogenase large subunit